MAPQPRFRAISSWLIPKSKNMQRHSPVLIAAALGLPALLAQPPQRVGPGTLRLGQRHPRGAGRLFLPDAA